MMLASSNALKSVSYTHLSFPMMEDFLMAINGGQMALIFQKILAGEWI